MKKMGLIILVSLTCFFQAIPQEPRDSDRLGMALEYFRSAKYHEALLIFEKLDRQYHLNPRFHAYMGVCYYYEWLYEEACKYLDEAIPQLDAFAPHERSVYYFTDGESHFQLQQYAEAIPYYERALTVCYENEKGEIYYRLGFCYLFAENWEKAHSCFKAALDNYLQYRNSDDMNARITQTAHMMKGCEEHLKKDTTAFITDTAASITDTTAFITDTTALSTTNTIVRDTTERPIKNAIERHKVIRDTIRNKVPEAVNIDEIYRQKIEIKE
ncbi:MAG: tetratricopeptide repeat protein [Prevotella sp.]|nr:tetratricopeptide repeat protein [Prevotella sp.]